MREENNGVTLDVNSGHILKKNRFSLVTDFNWLGSVFFLFGSAFSVRFLVFRFNMLTLMDISWPCVLELHNFGINRDNDMVVDEFHEVVYQC